MQKPPIPVDEERRLALLSACKIMYTPAEQAFDEVAQLAADLCGTEIALITLVDSDYQWFKARVGVEQTGLPRDLSFCGHCINHRDTLIVEDTLQDARFADNPLVVHEPGIRFYAGVPLLLDSGSAIGALSVADRTPRSLAPRQLASLQSLARQIARELSLRARIAEAARVGDDAGFTLGPGAIVADRWQIVRRLGSGGTGTVYEAHDAAGERVAVKVLLPQWAHNELLVERFAREARVLTRLSSPHVGRLLDVGNLDASRGRLPYLVLEYLEGTDLERILEQRGRIGYRDALAWCADACLGLAAAHDLGIVHRDLKPSNVFLSRQAGAGEVVKVLDFGIAVERQDRKEITGVDWLGSPAYMSPEQMLAASGVDARSDVWSMGVTLYHLVNGRLPFSGESPLEVFSATLSREPAAFEDGVPAPVAELILRCLQRSPQERWADMRALAEAQREVA